MRNSESSKSSRDKLLTLKCIKTRTVDIAQMLGGHGWEQTTAIAKSNQDPQNPTLGPIDAPLRLAAVVDSSDDAIMCKDLDGIITRWNAAATKMFGDQPDEIVGRSILTLIPEHLHPEEPEILRKLRAGEKIEHMETQRVSKSGRLIEVSLTISPVRDESGHIIGISKIVRDITERKQTEEALMRSQRLASLGQMTAAISHEVNNPLGAMVNLLYLLQSNPSLDADARYYVELMRHEVTRISEISKQTLSFSRESTVDSEFEAGPMLEELLHFHAPMIRGKSINVTTRLRKGIMLRARPTELKQVFTNLVLNAIDAMPDGGNLSVRTATVDKAGCSCITIADNGSGVPESIRSKLFEPFFSTKQGTGTGLGLWISASIIKKYRGQISMRTSDRPGRSGTIFRVCLPSREMISAVAKQSK